MSEGPSRQIPLFGTEQLGPPPRKIQAIAATTDSGEEIELDVYAVTRIQLS